MTIAIIADIHDNLIRLKECLDICAKKKVTKIICLGDLGNDESLTFLNNKTPAPALLVKGNADIFSEDLMPSLQNIKYFNEFGYLNTANLILGFCHKEKDIPLLKKEYPFAFNFIFFGHSHKPDIKTEGKTILVNPGNIAGIYYRPTFAFLATKNQKLDLELLQ